MPEGAVRGGYRQASLLPPRLHNALGHAGVPFDSASIVDLASGKLKDYKVYVFCNLHLRTPSETGMSTTLFRIDMDFGVARNDVR
jgi:hypothetical protein